MKKKGILRVGTSGIALRGKKDSFPVAFRQKSRLAYYGSLFNTLEVNSSFYKLHQPSTFEKWAKEVPDDFEFTIKLWKAITHVKHLDFNPADLDTFLQAANDTGNKSGCLLIQFSASINAAYAKQVTQILEQVKVAKANKQWRIAVEFRDNSWYNKDTYQMLKPYNSAMVLHDMSNSKNLTITTANSFYYFRFHGPIGNYGGSYTNAFLEEQAAKIQRLLNSGKDVYAYFNNTMGEAFENAMTLKGLVGEGY